MGKRKTNPDKKMFFDTLHQVRQLVAEHRGGYTKDVMGLNQTNTRMPYTHLTGRRQKLRARHAQQKARAQEEAIQYDSSLQLLNSNIVNIQKQKDSFQKNQYKYQQAPGTIGREKDGFLVLGKKDLQRIRGLPQKEGNSPVGKQLKGKKYRKSKKVRKGKKGRK